MKNLATQTVLLFLVLLLSCTKTSSTNEKFLTKLDVNDFTIIGKEHNKTLSYVLDKLIHSQKISAQIKVNTIGMAPQGLVKENILDATKIVLENYVTDYSSMYNDPTGETALQIITEVFNGSLIVDPNGKLYSQSFENLLTTNEKILLDNLSVILNDDDVDLSSIQNRISLLETAISDMSLTIEEQFCVYSATSVAKSTLQYWHDNYSNWQILAQSFSISNMNSNFSNNSFSYFQDPRRVMGTKFSWKELGRSDVAGAAWGAAACGVARFFGPLGWKVWVIGIVGSAAGGSAYNAVDQLLK